MEENAKLDDRGFIADHTEINQVIQDHCKGKICSCEVVAQDLAEAVSRMLISRGMRHQEVYIKLMATPTGAISFMEAWAEPDMEDYFTEKVEVQQDQVASAYRFRTLEEMLALGYVKELDDQGNLVSIHPPDEDFGLYWETNELQRLGTVLTDDELIEYTIAKGREENSFNAGSLWVGVDSVTTDPLPEVPDPTPETTVKAEELRYWVKTKEQLLDEGWKWRIGNDRPRWVNPDWHSCNILKTEEHVLGKELTQSERMLYIKLQVEQSEPNMVVDGVLVPLNAITSVNPHAEKRYRIKRKPGFQFPVITLARVLGKDISKELYDAVMTSPYGYVHKFEGSNHPWIVRKEDVEEYIPS